MKYRIILAGLAAILLFSAGCRTGNYQYDKDIYARMPDLLMNDPELQGKMFIHQEGETVEFDDKGQPKIPEGLAGSPAVAFDQGEMSLWFAYKLDPGARRMAASRAFEIFHEQYMNNPDVRKSDGTFKREKIYFRGYIDDIELYVIEWTLGRDDPTVLNDREGNFV
ncbi:MAG TPA: hypothetical protein VGB30_09735 [bacterium]|jgi:hypothetical protein